MANEQLGANHGKAEWIKLWSARTGRIELVSIGPNINGGGQSALSALFEKRISGKQIWWPVATMESWTEAEREARLCLPAKNPADDRPSKAVADTSVEAMLAQMSPAERRALAAKLDPKPPPTPPADPPADPKKSGGRS